MSALSGLTGVTGASGELGGRVAARLAARGVAQRLIVRTADHSPSLQGTEIVEAGAYGDPRMRSALDGVDTLYLVSAREAPDRVAQHEAMIDAAVAASVPRIVYVSYVSAAPNAIFTFARDHFQTEDLIRSSGLRYTFLRSSPYLDVLPFLTSADGEIRGPAGEGRVAWVARDDIADATVPVLLGDGHDGRTYTLSGPEALTLDETAARLTTAMGRPIRYVRETLAEAYASRSSYGAADWQVEGWISTYTAIAAGQMATVTSAVRDLSGHAPQSVPAWLAAHAEARQPPG